MPVAGDTTHVDPITAITLSVTAAAQSPTGLQKGASGAGASWADANIDSGGVSASGSQAASVPRTPSRTASRNRLVDKASFFSPGVGSAFGVKSFGSHSSSALLAAGTAGGEAQQQEDRVSFWRRAGNTFEVVGQVVRKHPVFVLLPPLLVLMLLVSLGVYGTLKGAETQTESQKDVAASISLDTATSFKLSVEQSFAPLITLNSFIQQMPTYTRLITKFPSIASNLLEEVPDITNLQFSPFGVIRAEVPWANHTDIDIFATPALRDGALHTLRLQTLVLSGPQQLTNGGGLSGIARLPIFVGNVSASETFGNNASGPTGVDMSEVYNQTSRKKFWGFVTAIMSFNALVVGQDSRLHVLADKGYRYLLTRPATVMGDPAFVLCHSDPLPSGDTVSTTFVLANNNWTLTVISDAGTWEPSWKWPVVAAVVVISVFVSLLVFVMMISLKQQTWLLCDMMAINHQLSDTTDRLEAQQVQHEAMLVRQYNLINCFSNPAGRSDLNLHEESTTLDRIQAIRQQLASENVKNLAETEQIQTLEVLGEGTFGKVYKGLWRGTEVAIKTMVLPANMTGQEKREKMAVMEAAISSSLAHPNVVTTYTYSIKPVRDTTVAAEPMDTTGMVILGGSTIKPLEQAGPGPGSESKPSPSEPSAGGVHSFEVRLVLEFCDKGCLRELLDSGALFCDAGFNYRAVLDTALDVAKAMCHLHSMNVLHSDLKARNVMLKSAGDPRGFIAKVADFGLSVKMDQSETHMSNLFQGTMTHMAPEIMLEGRVSKAADVYAFGVTLWELFSCGSPFQGTPRALIGHLVSKEHKRPAFSVATPSAYRRLTEACWAPEPSARPTFEQVLATLQQLRAAEGGATEPIPFPLPVAKTPEDASLRATEDDSCFSGSGASKQRPFSVITAAKPLPCLLQPVLENEALTETEVRLTDHTPTFVILKDDDRQY